jgi:hypothetical protein
MYIRPPKIFGEEHGWIDMVATEKKTRTIGERRSPRYY